MTLREALKAILSRIVVVVLIPFTVMAVTAFINYNVLSPTYTAETTMYVLNKQSSDTVSYNDLISSGLLIADYRELALSQRVTEAAATGLGLSDLNDYDIDVTVAGNTRVIKISVVGTDPEMAAAVSNALSHEFSACVTEIMQVENVSVVDPAKAPQEPSGPARARNIMLSAVIGLVFSVGLVLLIAYADSTIREAEDVEEQLGLPVLAQIPRFDLRQRQ